ncbi:MAG TPA: hypothetical protein DCS66_04185, partial [Flavobacteriaceae bacterium]|nr:hypothetical protein [Flavobacteriaceae bacterium]
YLKKPHTEYDSHKLAVKTVDGSEDLVNYKARKNGDEVEIEFDIRDDYHNNQHIFLDKKNKKAELIDENYYMTSPEDYAKDDPIIWDVSKPSIKSDISKKALDRSIILDKTTKADDYIYDYMSMPEGSDYNYMWERYVDSFSPAGNIFKTKEYAKKIKKEEAHQKKLREERAMDNWEEQFRGGHGTHGYYRGGMSMDDYKPQVDESRRMIKLRNMSDVEALARMMHAESSSGGGGNLRDAQAIGHVIQNRSKYTGPDSTYGLKGYENYSPIKRVLAGQGQFTPFRSEKNLNFWDFDMTEEHPYYKYAAGILSGNKEDFTGGSTMFDLDPNKYAQGYNEFWNFNPSQFEHEGPHSFWGLTPRMNKGGIARRPNAVPPTSGPDSGFVTEGIDLIKANPQRFVAGGLVKKYAPKVLGKKSIYKPLITERKLDLGPDLSRVRTDLYTPPKGPYTITNESGARVLDRDFKTLKEAQDSLKEMVKGFKTQDATTFRIFGARPPKTAAGVSESAPEVNLGMVGKPLPKEKPAAMFWGSREKIIGAPSEAMTGKQWLQYLQIPKHGILNPKGLPVIKHAELNDTGLAPYLSKNKDSILSKEKLVKDFDSKLAPEIEVIPLGRMGDDGDNFYGKISNMDMQAYREGPLKNVLTGIRNIAHPLREALSNNNKEAILKIINGIDNLTFENFGVTNAIKEGFPQKFPFELKKVLQSIAQASGVRTTGFKQYARDTKYKGQQTLGGGENYREFVFKYKHPTGSIRETEPVFPYSSHDFGLSSSKRENAFVHSRVSDRTDEFGRRVLHIEEIQSDMHQRINAAARKVRKAKLAGEKPSAGDIKKSKYSPRGDLIKEPTDLANEQQMQLVLSKIEDLAALPQTKQTQIRIARLNKERAKIRKIIEDKRSKMSEGKHSGVAMGPLSKSEDYNEFVMKYLTKVAQEGGYDGVTISSGAIKNRGEEIGSIDWKGNLVAYGPIAEGAMKKVAKKSGAKFMKTVI